MIRIIGLSIRVSILVDYSVVRVFDSDTQLRFLHVFLSNQKEGEELLFFHKLMTPNKGFFKLIAPRKKLRLWRKAHNEFSRKWRRRRKLKKEKSTLPSFKRERDVREKIGLNPTYDRKGRVFEPAGVE